MSGALAGLRVLDFTMMIAGPYGARLMADQGAEVIKIEPPTGDPMRGRTPFRDGKSTYYGALNAGKKSIVLDLKSPVDQQLACDLVATADVVIENFRPGVMAKFGLGYDACREINPDLVYCSVSGFGQSGPLAHRPALAPVVHAMSGFDLANMDYQRADRPASTAIYIADVAAGQAAYSAILTALIGRAHQGGQHVDVSLLDVMLALMVFESQEAQSDGSGPKKTVYRPLETKDEFVVIAALSDKSVTALIEAMGRSELLSDPAYATMGTRELHWDAFYDMVGEWTVTKTGAEVEAELLQRGVPCARYRTIAEMLSDEHTKLRGSLREVATPNGTYEYVGPPFVSLTHPYNVGAVTVSDLGADNDTVLRTVSRPMRSGVASV